jgi:hypothetical protein
MTAFEALDGVPTRPAHVVIKFDFISLAGRTGGEI